MTVKLHRYCATSSLYSCALQGDHRLHPFTLAGELDFVTKCNEFFFLRFIEPEPSQTSMFSALLTHHHDDVTDGHVGASIDDSEAHGLRATGEFSEGDELGHV